MKEAKTKQDRPPPAAELLSTLDFEETCKIPRATQAKMRWNGTGPNYVKLGSRVLYRRCDIDAWIAANLRETGK